MENKKTIIVKFPLFAPKSLDDWLTRPSLDENEVVTLYDIYQRTLSKVVTPYGIYQRTLSDVERREFAAALKKTFWTYLEHVCREEGLSNDEIVVVKEAVKKALSGEKPTEETEDKIVDVIVQMEGNNILILTVILTDKTSTEDEPYHPTAKKLFVKILKELVSELRWGGDNLKC